MPRARNKIDTARQVYFSLEMYRSLRRMTSAVRQQLTIVRKYRITVSQPPIVGSPIPGLQSNSCIRGSWLLALRNESWPNKKTARRRSLYSRFDFGQAATAALERRRYVMKPMPAKPRIIMPQVEGSGTAATVSKVVVEK